MEERVREIEREGERASLSLAVGDRTHTKPTTCCLTEGENNTEITDRIGNVSRDKMYTNPHKSILTRRVCCSLKI